MKLGWAFFGLAVLLVVAYSLNDGIYVGSDVETEYDQAINKSYFVKNCRYLYISGITDKYAGVGDTQEEADDHACSLLGKSN